eukprot:scaffold299221_cov40-Tisochrysis_lutea.AAC.1
MHAALLSSLALALLNPPKLSAGERAAVDSRAATLTSRRDVLSLSFSGAAAAAAVGRWSLASAAASESVAVPPEIRRLAQKAKALRAFVRSTAATTRKSSNAGTYVSLAARVQEDKEAVLLPLQAALAAYTAKTSLSDPELQKQLGLQPLLMKGHLLELDQALTEFKFDEYVSKTTGDTYPGGKVERELEEVRVTW